METVSANFNHFKFRNTSSFRFETTGGIWVIRNMLNRLNWNILYMEYWIKALKVLVKGDFVRVVCHSWDMLSYMCTCILVQPLCVSFPSATEFSAISFLLFARSGSNFLRSFKRFRQTLRRNQLDSAIYEEFSHRPPL